MKAQTNEADKMESLSIHPRNWKDGNKQVKDTSKPRKRKSLSRRVERLRVRQDDWMKTCAAVGPSNQSSYKRPGSMTQ